MITIRIATVIQRPIAEVYAYLANYENDVHWRTGLVAMRQTSDGPATVGTKVQEVMTFMGRRVVIQAEVVVADTNRRTILRSISGPVKSRGQRLFEKQYTGTRFTYQLSLEPTGFLGILSPIIGYLIRKQLTKDIDNLKQQLETANHTLLTV